MTAGGTSNTWTVVPISLDSVVYPDGHPRSGEVGPVYAYAVRNEGRVILVDTGIGPAHPVIDRLYQPKRRALGAALRADAGIELADMEAVILSHLHFDHVGGAQALPGTPLYVQRTEWEAAQAEKYTVPEFLAFPSANFVLLDGDTELAPGLELVVTADHTPGHQAVVVSTAAGPVVLAGQSVETTGELLEMQRSGAMTVGAERLLAFGPVQIWFSHDHEHWEPGEA